MAYNLEPEEEEEYNLQVKKQMDNLVPWFSDLANQGILVKHTFLHIQQTHLEPEEEEEYNLHDTAALGGGYPSNGGGMGGGAPRMNLPLKKKVASFHDLASHGQEASSSPPQATKLSKSASWPTLGPSSEDVYVSSLVSKMFYKSPAASKQNLSGLAGRRSVSFASTDGFGITDDSDDFSSQDGHWAKQTSGDSVEASWVGKLSKVTVSTPAKADPASTTAVPPTTPASPKQKKLVQQELQGSIPQKNMVMNDEGELVKLPSVGSANHFKGTCRPCCFKLRQRCSLGMKCKHCHFSHEKFQRPGKKTRDRMRRQRQRAANGEPNEDDDDDEDEEQGSVESEEKKENDAPAKKEAVPDAMAEAMQTTPGGWTKISF